MQSAPVFPNGFDLLSLVPLLPTRSLPPGAAHHYTRSVAVSAADLSSIHLTRRPIKKPTEQGFQQTINRERILHKYQ